MPFAVSQSAFAQPSKVTWFASVPLRPYLSGFARLCIMSTTSDISTKPSLFASPRIFGSTLISDVVTVVVVSDVVDVVSVDVVEADDVVVSEEVEVVEVDVSDVVVVEVVLVEVEVVVVEVVVVVVVVVVEVVVVVGCC